MDVAENRSAFDTTALKAEIYAMFYKLYDRRDEQRIFSSEQRRIIWNRNGKHAGGGVHFG